jgi:CheY-like chemotaxis protein
VLDALRSAGSKAKVIVLTGSSEPGESKLWAKGVEAVLEKPVKLSLLFHLLDK